MNDQAESSMLESIFDESETQLLLEALHDLKAKKLHALKTLQEDQTNPAYRQFGPADFGVPQIDALISRFAGE